MPFTVKISIGPLATVTDYIVFRFYTAQDPGVQVDIETIAPPHPSSRVLSKLLENDVAHICKIYYSPDGITLGSLKHEFEFQPINQTIDVYDPIELHVVPSSPGEFEILADQDEYHNTFLAGKKFYPVQRGTGQLRDDEWDEISTGGVKLLAGKKFDLSDTYFIHFIPQIRQDSFPSLGQLNDIKIVTTSETLDDTYYKKINDADFSTTIGTTTFPDFSSLPNMKMKFTTHGGLQRYWKIQFAVSNTAKFLNISKNVIYLGKGEELEMIIKGGVCRIIGYNGEARYVGQRIWGDRLELNTILRDGTQYNQVDYPRLVEWIKLLPVGQVVDEATWATSATVNGRTEYPNKGKFALDDDNGKFRVPDDRERFMRSLKFLDATVDAGRLSQGPGGLQGDQNLEHDHFLFGTTDNGGVPFLSSFHGTGGNLGYALSGSNDIPDFGKSGKSGGTEAQPKNTGLLPLLVI